MRRRLTNEELRSIGRMTGMPPANTLPGNIATAEAVGRMEIVSGPAVVRVGAEVVPRHYTGA
jgi:hypothetical protein